MISGMIREDFGCTCSGGEQRRQGDCLVFMELPLVAERNYSASPTVPSHAPPWQLRHQDCGIPHNCRRPVRIHRIDYSAPEFGHGLFQQFFRCKRGHPSKIRYGCKNHRFRNTCTNKVTILRNRLEQQLIAAISKNLLDARLEQQRVQDFSAQFKATLELEEKLAAEAASQTPKMKTERADLEQQAGRLEPVINFEERHMLPECSKPA
jgi:hypothetical protein